jgi:membrane protein YdbS with pleckstrin-like domain
MTTELAAEHSPANVPATTRMLAPEFGLALMQDEQVLLRGEPQREQLLKYMMVVALLTIFAIPLLPLIYLIARAAVRKHQYWVTSSRVVVTNGIIGFRARSIPLERVSDVAISCNWLERALGLRSVIVRDMTGEALNGAAMMAAPDATGLQRQLLDEVHKVNRRAPSADGERMHSRTYREIEGDHSQAEMLALLRRIEANTRAQ